MRYSLVATPSALVALVAFVAACSGEVPVRESRDVATADLGVAVNVQSNGSVAVIEVSLSAPDYAPLAMSPDEGFAVDAEGAPTHALAVLDSRALVTVASPGSVFFLRHARPDGTRTRTIELPPPFVVEAPAKASRAAPLTLRWKPNEAEPVAIVATSGCFVGSLARRLERDRGEYTFAVGDFRLQGATDCPIVFRVTRTRITRDGRNGTTATQVRTVIVETTP